MRARLRCLQGLVWLARRLGLLVVAVGRRVKQRPKTALFLFVILSVVASSLFDHPMLSPQPNEVGRVPSAENLPDFDAVLTMEHGLEDKLGLPHRPQITLNNKRYHVDERAKILSVRAVNM